jgi:hypothetical protein
MRINSTVALTLLLLVLMVGAGIISALYGYSLGREALTGVKQPDVRPATVGENAPDAAQTREFEIIPETQILEDVDTQMNRSAVPTTATPTA